MGWLILLALLALALGPKGTAGGGGGGGVLPPGGGGGGGGGVVPGGGGGTWPPGIKVWGNAKPTDLPDWFKADGNSFWISPTCDAVAEGTQFLPVESHTKLAIEEPTLAETLAIQNPPNSAYGFIDYLLDVEGIRGAGGTAKTTAEAIASRFVFEAHPPCAKVLFGNWPAPLREWWSSFAIRIQPWVADSIGGIPFG